MKVAPVPAPPATLTPLTDHWNVSAAPSSHEPDRRGEQDGHLGRAGECRRGRQDERRPAGIGAVVVVLVLGSVVKPNLVPVTVTATVWPAVG